MREATGQVGLMNIMLFVIGIIIILLAGSIAYSKAFRVKNKIIDIIEKHNAYDSDARDEITSTLTGLGYRTASKNDYTKNCKDKISGYTLVTNAYPNHLYCVYKADNSTSKKYYYKVVAYMYFDLPVIGAYVKIPVSGETKVLYADDDWKTVN